MRYKINLVGIGGYGNDLTNYLYSRIRLVEVKVSISIISRVYTMKHAYIFCHVIYLFINACVIWGFCAGPAAFVLRLPQNSEVILEDKERESLRFNSKTMCLFHVELC